MSNDATNPGNSSDKPNDPQLPPQGHIVDRGIDRELAESYLTYAMSTIIDRALPDVRDGLKPSQRRILVAMNDLNLSPGRKHTKCAGIVGETMKKYHPHGDQAIYPTLVNMAQEWKTRYLLVDKQGNFGSIDPDPPAAMRYTEARLHAHAAELLEDLKLDTVDWQPSFDEATLEPKVLPAKFPNLLVNGSTGIAVGMACSMVPHNLGEICDAIVAVLDNPDITLTQLLQFVPGPDFPTGGTICGRRGIIDAYATGRGKLTVRGKIHHEESATGQNLLVVTEIPYQVTKTDGVVEKIKECRNNDKLTELSDIVDESSNRGGMRLVIKLKKGADPIVVENLLYQLTPLQDTVSVINIALVRGQPQTLGLRALLDLYIEHRIEIVRRRTAFRLRQAQQEAHRIEGLIYAVCDIDEVIKLIRSSRTREEAIEKLIQRGFRIPPDHKYAPQIPRRFLNQTANNDTRLSRLQAEAIGRLQLIQLVGLAIDELVADYSKLLTQIEEYELILSSDIRVRQIIRDEVLELKTKYADPRRTVIAEAVGDLDIADLTPVETVAVTITHGGYVKRIPIDTFRTQGRGGKGIIGNDNKDDDFIEQAFVSSTHDDLLCFTNTGRVYQIKVYEIPEATRTSRGRNVVNLLDLKEGERVCQFMPIEDFEREETFLMFATAQGVVKRTLLADYRNVNRNGINAITLREGDSLIGVTWTSGNNDILLGTKLGHSIRFAEDDVRAMGRNASGVNGIDVAEGDEVVGLVRCDKDDKLDLLTVTADGLGKRTPLVEYLVQQEDGTTRAQTRGGKGRRNIEASSRGTIVVGLLAVKPEDDIMLITSGGQIVRISAATVRQTGRGTKGVRMVKFKDEQDRLAAIARIVDPEKPLDSDASAAEPTDPSVSPEQTEPPAPDESTDAPK